MTTEPRPIDPSTGKPRAITDAEALEAVAEFHASRWEARQGEVLDLIVLRDGLTINGKVYRRGEHFTAVIGSPEFWSTVDGEGNTLLTMDTDTQVARYGSRVIAPASEFPNPEPVDPYMDDRPNRSGRHRGPAIDRGSRAAIDGLKQLWREEDAAASQPVRLAHHIDDPAEPQQERSQ